MSDNSSTLLTIGALAGAGFLAYKYLGPGAMPSDVVYDGQLPSGAACQGSTTPTTGVTYQYYSPSTKQYYCTSTPPTATQLAAQQAGWNAATASALAQANLTASPQHLSCTAPMVLAADGTSCVSPAAPPPSLDSLGAQIVTAVGGQSVGPDQYNWYLTQIYPGAGPLPDPVQLFAGTGWERPQTMGFSDYWVKMAPWLKTNKGMSGLKPNQSLPPSTQLLPLNTGMNQAWRRIHGQYGVGDIVPCPPGNVCDLSLPGSRAAYAQPYAVLPETGDWNFPQSIGQDVGRSDMAADLPGRYYGAAWLAPNSGSGTSVGDALFADATGATDYPAAADIPQAAAGLSPIGPVTFITPMPSVLQPRMDQVTPADVQPCAFAQWVSDNPLPAVAGALALFFILRGAK